MRTVDVPSQRKIDFLDLFPSTSTSEVHPILCSAKAIGPNYVFYSRLLLIMVASCNVLLPRKWLLVIAIVAMVPHAAVAFTTSPSSALAAVSTSSSNRGLFPHRPSSHCRYVTRPQQDEQRQQEILAVPSDHNDDDLMLALTKQQQGSSSSSSASNNKTNKIRLDTAIPYEQLTIGVLKESFPPGENRVSQSPDSVAGLVKAGFAVLVQAGGTLLPFVLFPNLVRIRCKYVH